MSHFAQVAGAVRKGGTMEAGGGTMAPEHPVWLSFRARDGLDDDALRARSRGAASARTVARRQQKLATLRTDARLFKTVSTLRWRGATPAFAAWAERMEAPRLLERCEKAAGP
jgi:hypothetical protein